ncbi:glycosyltransferase [Paenibacillus sp. sgz500958]|uniref:glycosyltransferase n=1 Tax=Paenibacillus sp. sgz500958 TaxID=3242475 RepID=UPI0036D3510B
MKRLKILFVTKDFSQYLERNFYYFQLELAKFADLQVWHQPGEMSDILRLLPFTPDFILFNDRFHSTHCPEVGGIEDLKIPWGMIMHDLHGKVDLRRQFLSKKPTPVIFTIYRQAFIDKYPEYKGKVRWLPHFAEPSVFYDYKLPKVTDLLLMGCINRRVYPLRYLMRNTYLKREGFVYHKHPGYGNFTELSPIADNFAKEINLAKIFLTCDSILQYPLRKYFEVPACNTLLLAPSNEDLLALGFKSEKNFVAVNEHDFEEKVSFYLRPDNDSQRLRIAQQGYEFVHQNHSTAVRVQQLLQMIRELV